MSPGDTEVRLPITLYSVTVSYLNEAEEVLSKKFAIVTKMFAVSGRRPLADEEIKVRGRKLVDDLFRRSEGYRPGFREYSIVAADTVVG